MNREKDLRFEMIEGEEASLSFLDIGYSRLVQISSFAPLAPLSPSHRVGTPADSENGHDQTRDSTEAPAGAIGVSQALGPALPPASLLPPVEGPQLPGSSMNSTETAQEADASLACHTVTGVV